MTIQIPTGRGVESLFGTRDENVRLIESLGGVKLRLLHDSLELEGSPNEVERIRQILDDYFFLVGEGVQFSNGELSSYLRVVLEDPASSFRGLVNSGRQRNFGKKLLAPKTLNQRRYIDAIDRHGLTFGIGPAGTGKTYLAVAMAVSAYLAKKVNRIVLTRPAVEAGERLGFLPGDLKEKIDPYLRPLYDALFDMLEADKVEKLIERNVIEVAPLAFMRGRTLNDAFIILDEAQNTTVEQMKMALTRIGFSSKMVVTGDLTQVDLPGNKRSGLQDAIDILHAVEGISFIRFDDKDVVRHALVQAIVRAYDRHSESRTGRQLSLRLNPEPPEPEPLSPQAGAVVRLDESAGMDPGLATN